MPLLPSSPPPLPLLKLQPAGFVVLISINNQRYLSTGFVRRWLLSSSEKVALNVTATDFSFAVFSSFYRYEPQPVIFCWREPSSHDHPTTILDEWKKPTPDWLHQEETLCLKLSLSRTKIKFCLWAKLTWIFVPGIACPSQQLHKFYTTTTTTIY